jgi:hypothetical protein
VKHAGAIREGRRIKEEVRVAILEYIEPYHNKRRRHSALGYAMPIAATHCKVSLTYGHHMGGIPISSKNFSPNVV